MRTIIRQHWFSNEHYWQFAFRPFTRQMEVRTFYLDPRKAQHRKRKFWHRGTWIPFQGLERVREMLLTETYYDLGSGKHLPRWDHGIVAPILNEFEGLTSSVGRASDL